jgi:hypothetical protein
LHLTVRSFFKPDIYKNYLLRNVSPRDPEYDLPDLINDFYDMVKPKTTSTDQGKIMDYFLTSLGMNNDDAQLDDASGILTKEDRFRKEMYKEYIEPRSVALDAMKEGIRLYGTLRHYCQYKYGSFVFLKHFLSRFRLPDLKQRL